MVDSEKDQLGYFLPTTVIFDPVFNDKSYIIMIGKLFYN